MRHSHHPVFSDLSGRRWKKIKRFAFSAAFFFSVLGTTFFFSVLAIPGVRSLPAFAMLPQLPTTSRALLPGLVSKEEAARQFLASKTKAKLTAQIKEENHRKARVHARGSGNPYSWVIGFYVNWDPSCFQSIKDHIQAITYVMPEWYYIPGTGQHTFETRYNPKSNDPELVRLCDKEDVPLFVMLDNISNSQFQWKPLEKLLKDPAGQIRLAEDLRDELLRPHYTQLDRKLQPVEFSVKSHPAGINLDFELPVGALPEAEQAAAGKLMHDEMPKLVARMRKVFEPAGLKITMDLPAADSNKFFDFPKLGNICDYVVVMFYDQHVAAGNAGPIASQDWIEQTADKVFQQIDSSKVVLGLGAYCYDWPVATNAKGNIERMADGTIAAVSLNQGKRVNLATVLDNAREDGTIIQMDDSSLNPYQVYIDNKGVQHVVYILDAITAYNQVQALRGYQPRGAALWFVGHEDPALWNFFTEGKLDKPVKIASLQDMRQRSNEVSLAGDGEIMQVTSKPRPGKRVLKADEDGIIVSEQYTDYPSSYIVQRYGPDWLPRVTNGPKLPQKLIALTFDDGPDPTYTPQILDILKQNGVHATFFVVGKCVEQAQNIVRREWDEGNEVGNHTFTHPAIAISSAIRAELEVNTTQRLIESITGRSTRLFRPPYGGGADTNPTKAEEIALVQQVQDMGYLTVGMNIDPNDWDPKVCPDSDAIVRNVEAQLNLGNVLLLHDGGGDRTRTIEALKRLIPDLKAQGYKFVTVSELWNNGGRNAIFPPVTHSAEAIAGVDHLMFEAGYIFGKFFVVLFWITLVLGTLRIVITVPMAIANRRHSRRVTGGNYDKPVTVLVPAYNEEKVVVRTVRSILHNRYPDIRVIVIDDGSTDRTSEYIEECFGVDQRVTLIRKENGGKATALNVGLEQANTEVVICVDADTIIHPDAIRLLVQHFENPDVGAVAGNIKVGNRTNPLTIWQSVEYITNQNFDRRAYATLNSVSVVPGALGAWRKEAISRAGGYEANTMAEDADLTFKVRRLGYSVTAENSAMAYTEVPDTVHALAKQRFRWAFGILQCLWKHKDTLFRREFGAFGSVVLPTMWVYNVLFQAFSPLVDVMAVIAVLNFNFGPVLLYLAALFALDSIAAVVAFMLDKEQTRYLAWLFWQRFFYRQFMYYVILKSILHALKGSAVGWGKLQRKATAAAPTGAE